MNIFLDLGAYDGMSAEFFRKYHPHGKQFRIYSFECDNRNIEKLRKRKDLNIELIEKAVWTKDGTMGYYYGKDDGGSLYSTKKTGGITPRNTYEVETIDIARWIRENCTEEDYIIMKMNIEGVEYDIIPHLYSEGLTSWINKWFVQWHWEKVGISKEKHGHVQSLIPEWFPWECQLGFERFVPQFIYAL